MPYFFVGIWPLQTKTFFQVFGRLCRSGILEDRKFRVISLELKNRVRSIPSLRVRHLEQLLCKIHAITTMLTVSTVVYHFWTYLEGPLN